jgi:hypothetical protein
MNDAGVNGTPAPAEAAPGILSPATRDGLSRLTRTDPRRRHAPEPDLGLRIADLAISAGRELRIRLLEPDGRHAHFTISIKTWARNVDGEFVSERGGFLLHPSQLPHLAIALLRIDETMADYYAPKP